MNWEPRCTDPVLVLLVSASPDEVDGGGGVGGCGSNRSNGGKLLVRDDACNTMCIRRSLSLSISSAVG
jgi:hypothetical protein